MIPGKPSRMMHQSNPGVRRRRDSQPSIHLPRSVYLPSIKTGAEGLSRFSLGAKNSSLANSTAPPKRSDARSISSVKSIAISSSLRLWSFFICAFARTEYISRKGAKKKPKAQRLLVISLALESAVGPWARQTRRHHKPSAREEKSFLLLLAKPHPHRASACDGGESSQA